MKNSWDKISSDLRLVLVRHQTVVPIPLGFYVTSTAGTLKPLGIINISDLRKAVAEFDAMASPFLSAAGHRNKIYP